MLPVVAAIAINVLSVYNKQKRSRRHENNISVRTFPLGTPDADPSVLICHALRK
jgi:hypothetical protein